MRPGRSYTTRDYNTGRRVVRVPASARDSVTRTRVAYLEGRIAVPHFCPDAVNGHDREDSIERLLDFQRFHRSVTQRRHVLLCRTEQRLELRQILVGHEL